MLFGETKPSTLSDIILEWVGNVFSIIYFITPTIQIVLLYKNKLQIENIPMCFLISIVLNCLFWIGLGIMKDWVSMIICNGIGLGVNFVMVLLHLYKFFNKRLGAFFAFSLYLLIVIVGLFFIIKSFINDVTTGTIAMILNILMYSSPFVNIIKLIRKGEYNFLSILANIIGFFTCCIWLIYGITKSDASTIISNLISIGLVLIQIITWLVFFYRKKLKHPTEVANVIDEQLDIGIIQTNAISTE